MPANPRALAVTDAYRARLRALRAHAQQITERHWQLVSGEDLDSTGAAFAAAVAPLLTELQRAAARLGAAYLAAYLTVELGRPASAAPTVSPQVGASRAGKPLEEALLTALFTVKANIKQGADVTAALQRGMHRAVRNAAEDVMHTARATLDAGIAADARFTGWRRATDGGCGACLAGTTGRIEAPAALLGVHDGCSCTKEPVVAGVIEREVRPTGREMFDALTTDEQDQLLGPQKARLVRDGDVPLHALLGHSPMEAIPDQITERPLEALTP